MEQYPFYLEITWGYWQENKYIEKQEAVILFAETFANAVGKVEENYGEELISIEKVECLSDCPTIEMPISIGRQFIKDIDKYGHGEIPVEDKNKTVRWNPHEDANPPIVPHGTVIIVDYEA